MYARLNGAWVVVPAIADIASFSPPLSPKLGQFWFRLPDGELFAWFGSPGWVQVL